MGDNRFSWNLALSIEMIGALAHYRSRIAERGLQKIIRNRLHWYKVWFQMDNWWVGRLIELTGNTIKVDGVTLSVDNPQVLTMHKSSLYFGIYEIAERELAKRHIDPSLPLIEIGASIGGVSCITNRLLSHPSRHVVIECNPHNLPTLRKNRDLNECAFAIEPFAIAYGAETIDFNIVDFMTGNLSGRDEGTKTTVKTTTLKNIIDKYHFQEINLISDCEGAEEDLVHNESETLRKHVKRLILETHPELRGQDSPARVKNALHDIGFITIEDDKSKDVVAMENKNLI